MVNKVRAYERKLSDEQVEKILALKDAGEPITEIAAAFQVTPPCISKLGRTYRKLGFVAIPETAVEDVITPAVFEGGEPAVVVAA